HRLPTPSRYVRHGPPVVPDNDGWVGAVTRIRALYPASVTLSAWRSRNIARRRSNRAGSVWPGAVAAGAGRPAERAARPGRTPKGMWAFRVEPSGGTQCRQQFVDQGAVAVLGQPAAGRGGGEPQDAVHLRGGGEAARDRLGSPV